MSTTSTQSEDKVEIKKDIGRNDPCPCGSNKKYKRCCGFNAQPSIPEAPSNTTDQTAGPSEGAGANPFDMSQMDPQMMMQLSQALSRLPKGQMQKLQALMQKGISGKDVSKESAEFEKSLPVELQKMLFNLSQKESTGSDDVAQNGNVESSSKLARTWRKIFKKK